MEALQKAIEKIKEQQRRESQCSPERMLGNQLIGMLMRCPDAAQVVLTDIEGEGMSIQHCAAKLKAHADKIHRKEKGDVAISPEEAAKIIADFYGIAELVKPCLAPPEFNLPASQEPAPIQSEPENKPPKRKLLNLADFM